MNSIGTIGGFVNSRNILTIHGLSTDKKPIGTFQNCKIGNSSIYIEMDTHNEYYYDEENGRWIPKMTYIITDGGGSSSSGGEKEVFSFSSYSLFPSTGEVDKIYIDKSTRLSYIWDEDENDYAPTGDRFGTSSVGEYIENSLDGGGA